MGPGASGGMVGRPVAVEVAVAAAAAVVEVAAVAVAVAAAEFAGPAAPETMGSDQVDPGRPDLT